MSSRSASILVLVALVAGTGCTSFEVSRLRNRIDRDLPEAEIGEGFAMSFGFFTMGTARTVLALSDEGDESTAAVRALLRNVKKVQIGRYDVHGRFKASQISTPAVFKSYERGGWIPVVTVREDDEAVWVMAKEKRDDLRDLLVVVLSDEELVVAKMSGNLTRAVAAALSETDWTDQLARSLHSKPDSLAADSSAALNIP